MTSKIKMAVSKAITFFILFIVARNVISHGGVCLTLLGRPGRCKTILECGRSYFQNLISSTNQNTINTPIFHTVKCLLPLICCETRAPQLSYHGLGFDNVMVTPRLSSSPELVSLSDARLSRLPLDSCGVSSQDFIVNGKQASSGQFPWMALLCFVRDDGRDKCACGGSLVSSRYVITAAHCVTNLQSNASVPTFVVLGELNRNMDPDCSGETCAPPMQRLKIEEIICHPDYKPEISRHNDLALLRLVAAPDLSAGNICPVCLPIDKIQFRDLQRVPELIVAGWGSKDPMAETGMSRVLMFAGIREVSQMLCRQSHLIDGQPIAPSQMCASKSSQGTCRGDSGGPLIMFDEVPWNDETRAVLVGVVSFGPLPCVNPAQPPVFTRVAYYISWILDNIKP